MDKAHEKGGEFLIEDEAGLKAISHPLRMRLIHALREEGRAMTASELGAALGIPATKAHYHVRVLESAGVFRLERTELVNGITARYYLPAAGKFTVTQAALGQGPGLPGDFAAAVNRRFREFGKLFLEETAARTREAAAGRAPEEDKRASFILELGVHCSDEEWLGLVGEFEAIARRYAERREGTSPRRLFLAGLGSDGGGRAGKPAAGSPARGARGRTGGDGADGREA